MKLILETKDKKIEVPLYPYEDTLFEYNEPEKEPRLIKIGDTSSAENKEM